MVDNLMRSDHCIVNPAHIQYYMDLPCFHVEIHRCSLSLYSDLYSAFWKSLPPFYVFITNTHQCLFLVDAHNHKNNTSTLMVDAITLALIVFSHICNCYKACTLAHLINAVDAHMIYILFSLTSYKIQLALLMGMNQTLVDPEHNSLVTRLLLTVHITK